MLFFYKNHGWTIFSNKWEKMQRFFTDVSKTEKATDLSKHLLWIVYLNVMLNGLLLQCNLRIAWEELSKTSKVFLVSILIFAHINTVLRHTAKEKSCVLLLCTRCTNQHTSGKNYKTLKYLQQGEERGEKLYLMHVMSENHDTWWSFPQFERVVFDNK